MTAAEKKGYLRKIAMFCVLDGRPFSTIDCLGYRALIAHFSPVAAGSTPHPSTLNAVLDNMYEETKAKVIEALTSRYEAFRRVGYTGGFCSLQLDMTTVSNREFITFSTTLIDDQTGEQATYSLCTRVFRGTHKEEDIVRSVKQVNPEFCFNVEHRRSLSELLSQECWI